MDALFLVAGVALLIAAGRALWLLVWVKRQLRQHDDNL